MWSFLKERYSVVPTWTSADENVVSVSTTGLVTAVGKGSTVVSATINGNSYTINSIK